MIIGKGLAGRGKLGSAGHDPEGPHVLGHDAFGQGLHGFHAGCPGDGVGADDCLDLDVLHCCVDGAFKGGVQGVRRGFGYGVGQDAAVPVLPGVEARCRHLGFEVAGGCPQHGVQIRGLVDGDDLSGILAVSRRNAGEQHVVFNAGQLALFQVEIIYLYGSKHVVPSCPVMRGRL